MKHLKLFENFDQSITEGRIYKTVFTEHQKDDFRDKVQSHVKSLGAKTKRVGNDLEIHFDDKHVAQVMFRNDYLGVKKEGNKFTDEFEYTQWGDIKKELTSILKKLKK